MNALNSTLIVGCGNMGGAMLQGWLASGMDPARFTIVDPVLPQAPDGVTLLRKAPQAGAFDAVLLGVKPQMLADVAPSVEHLAGRSTLLLSILAGVEVVTLRERFPRAAGYLRIMPNLAAALGKSPVAIAGDGFDPAAKDRVEEFLSPLGGVEWLGSEALMDAVTALAGSGPAFVYRFIDALAAAATQLGLPAEQAERLALSTVEGASLLASTSVHSPGELARRVASPGGTTQAGLETLDSGGALSRLIEDTLRSARDRGAEMAAEARRQMKSGG